MREAKEERKRGRERKGERGEEKQPCGKDPRGQQIIFWELRGKAKGKQKSKTENGKQKG